MQENGTPQRGRAYKLERVVVSVFEAGAEPLKTVMGIIALVNGVTSQPVAFDLVLRG